MYKLEHTRDGKHQSLIYCMPLKSKAQREESNEEATTGAIFRRTLQKSDTYFLSAFEIGDDSFAVSLIDKTQYLNLLFIYPDDKAVIYEKSRTSSHLLASVTSVDDVRGWQDK